MWYDRYIYDYQRFKRYSINALARGFSYWTDTKPRTESQFKAQKFMAGLNPWYDNWMRTRAEDKWSDSQRKALGVGWSDISSPWVATLTGGSDTAKFYGSAVGSLVSKNINRLYK